MLCLNATAVHPSAFVVPAKRMRIKSSGCYRAARTHTYVHACKHTQHSQTSFIVFLLRSFGGTSSSHFSTHIRVWLTCVATTQPAAFVRVCVSFLKAKPRAWDWEMRAKMFVSLLVCICTFFLELISCLTSSWFLAASNVFHRCCFIAFRSLCGATKTDSMRQCPVFDVS